MRSWCWKTSFTASKKRRCRPFDGGDPSGTREIGLAVLATTISLVIVFLAGLVPVERHRPHAVSVWHHGDRRHSGFDVRQLHAHADDVQQAVATRPRNRDEYPQSSISTRFLSLDRSRPTYGVCVRAMRFRWLVLAVVRSASSPATFRSIRLVKQDYIPTNVDESEFEVR